MTELLGVLGGMGPLATVDFLRKLIEETPARCDEDHIPVVTYSVPQIPNRPLAITAGGESPLPALLAGIRALGRAGATPGRVGVAGVRWVSGSVAERFSCGWCAAGLADSLGAVGPGDLEVPAVDPFEPEALSVHEVVMTAA